MSLDVGLQDDLGRPGPGLLDVAREGQAGAAHVGHGQRTGRERVGDEGEVLDVLEHQQQRVVRLDVGLRRPVDDDGHTTVGVAVETDPLGLRWRAHGASRMRTRVSPYRTKPRRVRIGDEVSTTPCVRPSVAPAERAISSRVASAAR